MDQGIHNKHNRNDHRAARQRPPRLAIGGISHETNTFSPVPITLDDFRRLSYQVGESIPRQCGSARNTLCGIVDAAKAAGAMLIPTLLSSATPAGRVTRKTFASLREGLLSRLRTFTFGPWPLDGVILALHGAMVAEDADDAEGVLLRAVRDTVDPETTAIAGLDFQANVSPAMVEATDRLVGNQTFPRVDTYKRGQEAIDWFIDRRYSQLRPDTALRVLPLIAPLPSQGTSAPAPMQQVIALARDLERRSDVVMVTVSAGFPYSDISDAEVRVQVVSDNDRPLAESLAQMLAAAIWALRDRFDVRGLDRGDAIERVLIAAGHGRPVILADLGDNPGAGALGGGRVLLSRLIEQQVASAALATIFDPDAVEAATSARIEATIHRPIGGEVGPLGGESLNLPWRVQTLTCGTSTNWGPIGMGGSTRLSRTAALTASGVEIIVCERRVKTLDPELFRSVGIEPAARRVLAVKSSVHFRVAIEPIAADVIEAKTPGLCAPDLMAFPYRRLCRPIAPLDREVQFLD